MIKNAQLVEANNQKVSELQQENAAMQDDLAEYEGISEELANALGKLEEGDLETLLEKLHNAENQLDTYDYMDDIVIVYNVGLENRYNNTSRCITYGRASDENYKTYNAKPPLFARGKQFASKAAFAVFLIYENTFQVSNGRAIGTLHVVVTQITLSKTNCNTIQILQKYCCFRTIY